MQVFSCVFISFHNFSKVLAIPWHQNFYISSVYTLSNMCLTCRWSKNWKCKERKPSCKQYQSLVIGTFYVVSCLTTFNLDLNGHLLHQNWSGNPLQLQCDCLFFTVGDNPEGQAHRTSYSCSTSSIVEKPGATVLPLDFSIKLNPFVSISRVKNDIGLRFFLNDNLEAT